MSRKAKIYIRTTLAFTIIFTVLSSVILGGIWLGVKLFGGGGFSGELQKSYVNTLLCGVDKDGYRTDVLIFAQMNLIDNTINMVQIPRDTYVSINHVDKKINSAYGYNKEKELFKEVEHILGGGVEVNDYVLVNFKGFREMIDAIGGVEFEVPADLQYNDPYQDLNIDLKKGLQVLDGKKAEQLVRFRQTNDHTDIQTLLGMSREDLQQKFIYTAIDQLISVKNMMRIPRLASIVTENAETSFTTSEIIKYGTAALKIGFDNINIMTLPGTNSYQYNSWFYVCDQIETSRMVKEYFTPDSSEISKEELEIRDELIGDDSKSIDITGEVVHDKKHAKSITVDIIDGSKGSADIERIKAKIEEYGYKVKNTDYTNVSYSKSIVIAKKDDESGAKIADAIGLKQYRINRDKAHKTKVTVIVGTDIAKTYKK